MCVGVSSPSAIPRATALKRFEGLAKDATYSPSCSPSSQLPASSILRRQISTMVLAPHAAVSHAFRRTAADYEAGLGGDFYSSICYKGTRFGFEPQVQVRLWR